MLALLHAPAASQKGVGGMTPDYIVGRTWRARVELDARTPGTLALTIVHAPSMRREVIRGLSPGEVEARIADLDSTQNDESPRR